MLESPSIILILEEPFWITIFGRVFVCVCVFVLYNSGKN